MKSNSKKVTFGGGTRGGKNADRRALSDLAITFFDYGWDRMIREKMAPMAHAVRFAEAGIAREISSVPGSDDWKFKLTSVGPALLSQIVARTPADELLLDRTRPTLRRSVVPTPAPRSADIRTRFRS